MAKAPKAKKPAKKPAPAKKRAADKRGTPKGGGSIKPKHGGRIGNPPHEPTAELKKIAETHAAVGTPQWAIAEEMGISEDTLQRHYAKELRLGLIRMNARIGSAVAKKALEGSSEHERFWLARRGGQAWANKQELSTPPGQPLEFRNLSDEEINARIAEHEARRNAEPDNR
jgi:hypothetical protein